MTLPTYRRSREPITATAKLGRLNPVTPIPKSKFPKNPPTKAPTIPKTIAPKSPPSDGLGSIRLATNPAIAPNNNQDKMFINSY